MSTPSDVEVPAPSEVQTLETPAESEPQQFTLQFTTSTSEEQHDATENVPAPSVVVQQSVTSEVQPSLKPYTVQSVRDIQSDVTQKITIPEGKITAMVEKDPDAFKKLLNITKTIINAKYDPAIEAEVRGWIVELTGDNVGQGSENVQTFLRDGQTLVKLARAVRDGTPNCPPGAAKMKLQPSASHLAFKQMENIEIFTKFCENYGVPKESCFPTVDLYENRNMPAVFATIIVLGSECQRNGFNGPVIGPKPSDKNKRVFTREQLRAGEGMIGLQAGTNQFASQKGMSFGNARHIADIRADDMSQEGQGTISLQAGTNQFASQKGMAMGAVRKIADMKIDDMDQGSHGIVNLQAGTNQFASQKGMKMGAMRHISDIKTDDMSQEGQGVIGLQAGTNQFASQKGMSMGKARHIADIKTGDVSLEGSATINLQMGSNQYASQAGMNFGKSRSIID